MATAQKRRGSGSLKEGGALETEAGSRSKATKAVEAGSGDRLSAVVRPEAEALDEERIRERAYSIWIEEGQPQGRDVDHWLRARGELERKAA